MKVAFMASDAIALDCIKMLHAGQCPGFELSCVVSNPDKPKGRGKKMSPNDVSAWAIENGVELMRPEKSPDDSVAGRMRELVAIRNLGFRNVLLVAAENPKLVSSGYMESVIRLARSMVPSVSIEIAPSRVVDYKKYVDAGCEGLTVFQETYDEKVYPTLHPSGPKSVFEWRLATPERGAQAGMRKLGLGPLLGVNEWRFEVLAVALHAKFLFKRAWKSQISISLPRMRPAASGYIPEPGNIPNDRQTVQVICALRMFLPRLAIVVSTRESRKFRDGVMGLGVTMMSAFSSTKPGGYADREESGEQFHIDDSRNPEEFAEALRKRGIDPVWKDYDSALGA